MYRSTCRGVPGRVWVARRSLLTVAGLLLGLAAPGALAQTAPESRAASIAVQQQEKSQKLSPPVADRAEAIVSKAEAFFIESPSGFHPYFASIYHGGGLTLGAGYRRFYGDNTSWNINGLYSVKNYKLIEGGTESRDHLLQRLSFGAKLGWRDATQVAYYGLGMSTDKDDRTNFRFQQTYADGHVTLKPVRWFPIRATLAGEHWETKEGEGDYPSIETVHTPATAPGLGANPTYVHFQVSAGVDWRPAEGYARRGGLYQATLHDYRDTNGGLYSFQRLDAQIIQHIPLYRETWVLAGRARAMTTLNNNDVVPYFLLPQLGDGHTLRAFQTDRYRDKHSILYTAELRWIPSRTVDMAFFYDAGKVASQRNNLDFKGLKSDVGVGIRIHSPVVTPLRVDFAVGNEGFKMVISGGPVF